jgi:hypothetical protein
MSSNPSGSQTQPIGLRTLSDLLVSFLQLTSPTATDLSNPNQVNVFGLSASVATGANPGATVLNQLKLHDLISLLSSFVFEVKALTNGSVTSTISYQITGSSPTSGNALANGHSFATHVGTLSLADIVALLPQATFSVATPPGSQGVPWTVNGSVQFVKTFLKPHQGKSLVRLGTTSNPLGAEAPRNIASQRGDDPQKRSQRETQAAQAGTA